MLDTQGGVEDFPIQYTVCETPQRGVSTVEPMALFQGRYRIESTRLPDYDYASSGWYHVVVCTKHRACWFGEIVDGIMGLSSSGCIVADEWLQTPHIRPYVVLDAWIVMPNHVHGIPGIVDRNVETPRRGVSETSASHNPERETPRLGVSEKSSSRNPERETLRRAVSETSSSRNPERETPRLGVSEKSSSRNPQRETPHRGVSTGAADELARQPLGVILGQIKSACTKRIREAGIGDFAWQPRFYDRVIRDERELNATRRYILDNPLNWEADRYHPDHPT